MRPFCSAGKIECDGWPAVKLIGNPFLSSLWRRRRSSEETSPPTYILADRERGILSLKPADRHERRNQQPQRKKSSATIVADVM
jgi:hypothetical protein